MRVPLTLLTACVLAAVPTRAYPDGPPLSVCRSMQPGTQTGVTGLEGHTTLSQNVLPTYGNREWPPYYIHIHLTEHTYEPGQKIHVSIVANQTTGLCMYKGIMLQARRVVCASDVGHENQTIQAENRPFGTFDRPGTTFLLDTLDCEDIIDSAIVHKSPQFKVNETVTWNAPDSYSGHLVFRATIVQEAYIYWTDVHSAILQDPSEAPALTCSATRPAVALSVAATLLLSLVVRRS